MDFFKLDSLNQIRNCLQSPFQPSGSRKVGNHPAMRMQKWRSGRTIPLAVPQMCMDALLVLSLCMYTCSAISAEGYLPIYLCPGIPWISFLCQISTWRETGPNISACDVRGRTGYISMPTFFPEAVSEKMNFPNSLMCRQLSSSVSCANPCWHCAILL